MAEPAAAELAAAAGLAVLLVGRGAAVPTAKQEEAGHHALDMAGAAAVAGQVASWATGPAGGPAGWLPAAVGPAGAELA